jgi:hypothetical protein
MVIARPMRVRMASALTVARGAVILVRTTIEVRAEASAHTAIMGLAMANAVPTEPRGVRVTAVATAMANTARGPAIGPHILIQTVGPVTAAIVVRHRPKAWMM